jgi:4-hydroxy-4-methyl-2-oxoglutarate aldolase
MISNAGRRTPRICEGGRVEPAEQASDEGASRGPSGPADAQGQELTEHLAAARAIATATLFESNAKQGALPAAIKPLGPGQVICGPALPVATPPGDNYWIHRAVAGAAPGEVLVIATGGAYDNGYWGEILSTAALARGIGGVVIDGPARDGAAVVATGVPVFARGLNIIGPSKDPRCAGSVGIRIRIGGVQVDPGDLVVGDDDGVVVIARDRVATVIAAAQARERSELDVMARLRAGETTLEIFGLDSM